MSTSGAEYILRCDEFGEEQWARLIELRVERMRRHLKDIAAAKLESIPCLHGNEADAWASIAQRKGLMYANFALGIRGIFYVVRNRLGDNSGLRYSCNATESPDVPANHIFVFGLNRDAEWVFVDVSVVERDGKEYPLNLNLVWLSPQEIAKKAGVTLAWIFEGLFAEASRWESARDRLLQEARHLTDDLNYEHRVVWDAWRAHQERARALTEPADPTS